MEYLAVLAVLLGVIPGRIAATKGKSFLLRWIYGCGVFPIALVHSIITKPDPRWAVFRQTRSGYTTCTAMSGSGWKTAGPTNIPPRHPPTALRSWARIARGASCVGDHRKIMLAMSARPRVSQATRKTKLGLTGSVSPDQWSDLKPARHLGPVDHVLPPALSLTHELLCREGKRQASRYFGSGLALT